MIEILRINDEASLRIYDKETSLTFCPEESDFKCFKSQWLVFSIPRNLQTTNERWSAGELDFEIKDQIQAHILGQKLELIEVVSGQQGRQIRFLFSKERGLLAIGYLERAPALLSDQYCGFAAPDYCMEVSTPINVIQ